MGYMVPTLSRRGFQPVEPRRILRSMAVPSRDALAPSGKERFVKTLKTVFGCLGC